MKATEEIMRKAEEAYDRGDRHSFALEAAVDAVLADVPDVEPFAFPGCPDLEVYLHKCGTVMDVPPGPSPARTCVEAGECDCETTSPWHRIYVEKS